ncbi:hypothetical protein H0H92_007809 [Tricholoma furcatifolium]|nr:hypothetical protein H0H92_007809 [Tricholoma furcatifolium]
MPATSPSIPDSLPADESCELLGPTALVVQAVLGVFVILSLVYKRHREPRKRPWKIWCVVRHPWRNTPHWWEGFVSGVYGKPPSITHWARQALIYVLALTTMKFIVILLIVFIPGMFSLGEWLLSWTRIGSGDSVQVILYVIPSTLCYLTDPFISVMGLFPIIMNVLQFWLIDSIVKASTKPVALPDDPHPPHGHDQQPLFHAQSDDEDDDALRPDDIEQGRSRSPTLHISSGDSDEHKSGASSRDEPEDHSYPPSLSSSFTSTSSHPRPAKNLLKNNKRRTTPAPLDVHNDYSPAVNSPSIPGIPVPIHLARESEGAEGEGDGWTQSWDDQDDWENRHEEEEEEWTVKRTPSHAS